MEKAKLVMSLNLYESEIGEILKKLGKEYSEEKIRELIESGLANSIKNAIMQNGYWSIIEQVIEEKLDG